MILKSARQAVCLRSALTALLLAPLATLAAPHVHAEETQSWLSKEERKPRPPAMQPFHKTSASTNYKCLFNYEGLIFCTFMKDKVPGTTGPEYIGAFIDKLKGTDVDAVMFCPQAWRTNIYPSEIDPRWRKYREGQNSTGGISMEQPGNYLGFDRIMKYIHAGGDPVQEALNASRKNGIDFFISYRMNDAHHIRDLDHATNTDFWRSHPEYWLGDSNISVTFKADEDNVRMHNYMLEPVRDWYFSIFEELCTNYDVDGLELDFQRAPRFFYNREMEEGKKVMTGFIQRIRVMLDRLGKERGKSLKLCVRVPETLAKCDRAGLDVARWDELGLVDMINMSPYYLESLHVDIEGFQAKTTKAKLYAELEAYSQVMPGPKGASYADRCRFTTLDSYRAAALNFLTRGADGISFFNFDYPIPLDKRAEAARGLKGITDTDYLRTLSKTYVMVPFQERLMAESNKWPKDEFTADVVIPDDTSKVEFSRAILRVETLGSSADLNLAASLNGKPLEPCEYEDTEFSPPVKATANGYPSADKLKFFTVPLADLLPGRNRFEVRNLDKAKSVCEIFTLELRLFRPEK